MSTFILSFSLFLFFHGIRISGRDLINGFNSLGLDQQRRDLDRVVNFLQDIEDTLIVGLVPDSERWSRLERLPHPWGRLAYESLQELRECGGSLLPTLKRLRALASEHRTALAAARAKSSQALAQAIACSMLVPVLGFGLYFLLPAIQQNLRIWLSSCALALMTGGIGGLWLMRMTEVARWGGLDPQHRTWMLISQCAGERFLALIRTGVPPDLAWTKSCGLVAGEANELAKAWGHSVWDTPQTHYKKMEKIIVAAGSALKKAIQVSLMEGCPCTERTETVLEALKKDIQAQIEGELSVLATRALKPLFVCIAPALLGLLVVGIWLATRDVLQDNLILGDLDFGF